MHIPRITHTVVLVSDPICPITLEPLETMLNPVYFASDTDPKMVFELDALLSWLLTKQVHPVFGQRIKILPQSIVPVFIADHTTTSKINSFVTTHGKLIHKIFLC